MKRIVHLLFGRLFLVGFTIVLQFAWICFMFWKFSYQYAYTSLIVRAFAIVLVLVIVNRWTNPLQKLSWTFLILLSPLFGVLLYVFFGRVGLTKRARERMAAVSRIMRGYLLQREATVEELKTKDLSVYRQFHYIWTKAGYPIYQNTDACYYRCGEDAYPVMLKDLRQAEKFIFLEYYIVEKGEMFCEILSILEQKVKEGVLVRFIYDDVGCVATLPKDFAKDMEARGIPCAVFHPFRPFLSVIMNNRDHRKIMVVDGKIGYTGGINLADEYINRTERFGYWKDAVLRLEGEGVRNLTVMFLGMWRYIKREEEDYARFLAHIAADAGANKGYLQPYGDSPLAQENVGENIYLNMINRAKQYIYIFTPYLIVDQEMLISLCNAAKSGIDVRIVTPGIPDKRTVYLLTQAYYRPLLEAGVRIFQYTPGFLHAKCFVSDDVVATVGTVNLDFRSLYLHFECGVWMYETEAVAQVKEDFVDTFGISREITLDFCCNRALPVRILQSLLRLFAPLL